MTRLLIQFDDHELADFRWSVIEETEQSAAIGWQTAAEEALGQVATLNQHPVILILPQQSVYLAEVELPERASRQVLSTIDYQVEEQLARDIESQHVALADGNANPLAVAVVERSLMQRCLALAQGHGLRLVGILPELFLCPWSGGVTMIEGQGGYLLRYGEYKGLKCNTEALAPMLQLVAQSVDFDQVTWFGSEDSPAPEVDGVEFEAKPLSSVSPGFIDSPVIDLQQRDFKLSSAWLSLGKAWKNVAILAAILLVMFGYNRAMALQNLENELAVIKQQQFELLQPYLPGLSASDNLKKALIDRLQQLQSSQGDQGFLALMLEFSRARAKFPEVEITRIGYQGEDLVFDISSAQLTKIETLLEAVQKQGVEATLVSLNIKPEQSSGRLVLSGGDDG